MSQINKTSLIQSLEVFQDKNLDPIVEALRKSGFPNQNKLTDAQYLALGELLYMIFEMKPEIRYDKRNKDFVDILLAIPKISVTNTSSLESIKKGPGKK